MISIENTIKKHTTKMLENSSKEEITPAIVEIIVNGPLKRDNCREETAIYEGNLKTNTNNKM